MARVRIFVDFWNFQLQWNRTLEGRGLDRNVHRVPWRDLFPRVLASHAAESGETSQYLGTHVYASVQPGGDAALRNFLSNVLDSFPGYKVTVKERKSREHSVRCTNPACGVETRACPACGSLFAKSVEKGIDTAILTDLIQYTLDDNLDTAVLVSGDADFVPAVEYVQKKTDKRIVQAHFRGCGTALRNAYWTHLYIDDLLDELLPQAKH